MALFGFADKKENSKKIVRPTVVRTQTVAQELKKIAESYEVPVSTLDFNILEIQTYTRMNDGSKEIDWESVTQDSLYELDDESALLNPFFEMKQIYEIEIFSKTAETFDTCPHLKIAVGANASKCKVYLSIQEGSLLESLGGVEENFKLLVNKRKIRAGIFIGIFDEMLNGVVSKISAHVKVEGKVEYKKTETHLIAESFEPTATVDDDLIMHFENKEEVGDNKKVDYSSRSFIQNVQKDELLIEYIKPKLGLPGRNCRGEFIQPTEPKISHETTFIVNDTIRVEDTEESIKYTANENGYIALEENTYLIKTDVAVGEISFKTTGSIQTGVDSDVSISVSEKDAVKDAIGTGMHVEVTEIDIEGNVGSNATVIAKRVTVAGQTHKTATMRADDIEINVHKGNAYGKKIKITRLEHGTVDGDYVTITQALGGNIRAKEIHIDICSSHVHATSSKLIEINKLQGSENFFTIDPLLKKDAQHGLEDNKDSINDLKSEIRDMKLEIDKYKILIKEGTPAFLEIKKKLLHYKKSGVKLPSAFVKKYKQFSQLQEYLKGIQAEYDVKQDSLAMQTTRTSSFQDNILDARVINRDKWVGFNEIKFKLVDPPIELVHRPAEGSVDMIFGLKETEDGEYEIKAMTE